MTRRVERLTPDHLPLLAGGCAACAFWQLDPVRRSTRRDREAEEKTAWVSQVLRDWGSCGQVVLDDDEVVAHLLWAPPVLVPGSATFATAPVGGDAVVVCGGYVQPAYRRAGLGRLLVQGMARELLRGGVRAVEAFGDARVRPGVRGDQCVLPVDFLLAVGFRTQRAHAVHPRMRMDLRTTLSIREELEKGLDRLLGAVKPSLEPAQPRSRAATRANSSRRSLTRSTPVAASVSGLR